MRDLTQHLTARADDNHAAPHYLLRRENPFQDLSSSVRAQVRFLAYHRIKPHAPPLVRTPVNSFEFHSCERTPQVANLMVSLSHLSQVINDQLASFRAWTTRVSNPVCSPRFRTSASILVQRVAFATGVLPNIYEFHLYTRSSAVLFRSQANQYRRQFCG